MKRISLVVAACTFAAACSPAVEVPSDTANADNKAAAAAAAGPMAGDPMKMMAPAAGDSDATRGYKSAMTGMVDNMPAYVGDPDIDVMKQMRIHHQAAIAMARVELSAGQDAAVRALAKDVITAQQLEIGVIDSWLDRNGDTAASATPGAFSAPVARTSGCG